MHDYPTVAQVLDLHDQGFNQSQIAREVGLSRSTVKDWLAGKLPRSAHQPSTIGSCGAGAACLRDAPLFHGCYAYTLGMYLGDGCISTGARGVHRLRISLDMKYPEIVFECRTRMKLLCPANEVGIVRMSGGAKGVVVSAYSKHWPCLFPQHGPGPKHDRPIHLESWQLEIVREEPELLLRGLIHSDGCRNINNRGRGSTWTGVRYLFSNRSADIRDLFCSTCDQLGIHWTTPDVYTISVARRSDTARLDEFIGPKR
jgi:hypothetical protein